MDDIELDLLLERARPELPRRGAAPTQRSEATLQRILKGRTRPRGPFLLLPSAAAVSALLAITLGLLIAPDPTPVHATATPPNLILTPISGSTAEVMGRLSTGISRRSPVIRSQSWALSMTIGDSMSVEEVAVQPEIRTVTHDSTKSTIEVRRGKPYDSAGNDIQIDGYVVGELTWAQEFGAGEYPYIFGDPPDSSAEFGSFLLRPPERPSLSAGGYLLELQSLLGERALTAKQMAALIGFLSTLPSLEIEGAGIDRLGRTGVSFAATDRLPGEFVDRVFVSDEGLGILSIETTYIGTGRSDVRAPAVFSYTAWE